MRRPLSHSLRLVITGALVAVVLAACSAQPGVALRYSGPVSGVVTEDQVQGVLRDVSSLKSDRAKAINALAASQILLKVAADHGATVDDADAIDYGKKLLEQGNATVPKDGFSEGTLTLLRAAVLGKELESSSDGEEIISAVNAAASEIDTLASPRTGTASWIISTEG